LDKNFLAQFIHIFKNSIPEVKSSEILSRFLRKKDWIRKSDGTVHPITFEPDVKLTPHQLSVFRIDGLLQEKIWGIGRIMARKNGWTLFGRADLKASDYSEIGLKIKADNKPRGHANIVNWPEKSSMKLLTKQLAGIASTVLTDEGAILLKK